jgi:hypothetical protein
MWMQGGRCCLKYWKRWTGNLADIINSKQRVMLWLEGPDVGSPSECHVVSPCPRIVYLIPPPQVVTQTYLLPFHLVVSLHVSVKSQSDIAASFLHQSRPHRLLPQFARRLPGLFPNASVEPPTGCLAAAPSRWPLGARARAPQVVPSRAKVTHKRDQCWWFSRAAGSHPDGRNRPARPLPP